MTSFEVSFADLLLYLSLAALLYAVPVVLGGSLVVWGLRGRGAGRRRSRVAVASGVLICLAPFFVSGVLPAAKAAYERWSRAAEREEGVAGLPLGTFYLPPENGVALPEGYELDTVIGEEEEGPKPAGALPPYLYTGYVYTAPDGAREFGRSVRVNQYLLPPGGSFGGRENDPCEEYALRDGRKVRVLGGGSSPADLAVSVLIDGTTVVEAAAELGYGDEFDARGFARSLEPIPKERFVERAGERGCFRFRSNRINDVPVLPACRAADES